MEQELREALVGLNLKIDKLNDRFEAVMFGNGEPEKGIAIRVDRIEQRAKVTGWLLKTVIAAIITVVAGAAYQLLSR